MLDRFLSSSLGGSVSRFALMKDNIGPQVASNLRGFEAVAGQ
jgi:hypothetical protein